jgi:mRNA deadenylase 3'-5' endonuclease subunit Ccr4
MTRKNPVASQPTGRCEGATSVTVISFNVLAPCYIRSGESEEHWLKRTNEQQTMLADIDADVVLLQESVPNQYHLSVFARLFPCVFQVVGWVHNVRF